MCALIVIVFYFVSLRVSPQSVLIKAASCHIGGARAVHVPRKIGDRFFLL